MDGWEMDGRMEELVIKGGSKEVVYLPYALGTCWALHNLSETR